MRSAAAWIAGLYTLAVAVFWFQGAVREGEADVVLELLLFIPWVVAPVAAAAGCAASSPTSGWAKAFVAAELLCVATSVFVTVQVSFFPGSSMDGLKIMVLPFFQLAGLVAFVIAASLFGWRERQASDNAPPL